MLPTLPITRRRVLAGLAISCISLPAQAQSSSGRTPDGFRIMRARPGAALPNGRRPIAIWGYDGAAPGPTLRVKRGEELRVRLVNDLPEPTAIHWHGVRLPNAMDGVPHLTQPPIAPGESFDYRFRPPDAGTFWYRPSGSATAQIVHGLRGALIVEESEPVAADRDVLLMFEDWHLGLDGAPDRNRPTTVNGAPDAELPVRPNERARLRLVNAAAAHALTLRIERHAALVMAIDGQPAEPFLARGGRVALGPGNRMDLFVDLTLNAGERAAILVGEAGVERPIVRLVYAGEAARAAPPPEPRPLPANPLPERLDLRGASRHELSLDALSPLSKPLHEEPPAFSVRRGRIVVLAVVNRTAFAQTVHLHGHHFRHLDRLDDGWKPYWLDTLTVPAQRTDRVAFLADNPGKWLIEAQALAHAQARRAVWFAVA